MLYVECPVELTLDSPCVIFVSSLISIIYNLEPLSVLLFGISIIYENESKVLFVLLVQLVLLFLALSTKLPAVYTTLPVYQHFQPDIESFSFAVLLLFRLRLQVKLKCIYLPK